MEFSGRIWDFVLTWVMIFVIALREARGYKRLETLDAKRARHELRAGGEPEAQRAASEGDPTW